MAQPPAATKPKGPPIRRLALFAVAALIVLGAGDYGYNWWTNGRFMVSTTTPTSRPTRRSSLPRSPATSRRLPAQDNVHVKAGDPLVILDDADYRNALAQASAQIATGQATIERLAQQIIAGNAAVNSAAAQLTSAQSAATNAKADFDRQQALEAKEFASAASLDTARTAMELTGRRSDRRGSRRGCGQGQRRRGRRLQDRSRAGRSTNTRSPATRRSSTSTTPSSARPSTGVTGNGAAEPGEFVQPASGWSPWCRSTTSTSMRTSRRPRSPTSRPARR
ncbi:MAG: biotin/lipoyl-binding protein [Bauldia sp.]